VPDADLTTVLLMALAGFGAGWVDAVVGRCHETAWRKNPGLDAGAGGQFAIAGQASTAEKVDVKGRPYMVLPRANPADCYYLHNPDGYYRAE